MALKAVFILGPDLQLNPSNLATVSTFYTQPGYLMIGDGSKNITDNDLALLKGKIDSNTRIDILAHGKVFSGHHTIWLETSRPTYTLIFFIQLTELNNDKPLHIHLWSCYGDLANKEIKFLPQKSVLVTHNPANFVMSLHLCDYSILQVITKLQKHTSHLSAWQSFLDNLSFEAIQTETVITWDKGNEYKFEVRPKLLDVLSNPTHSLQIIATDYQKFYNQLPFDALPELKSFEIEQQQATNFKHGYFIHSCRYSEQEELIYILESNKVDKLLLEASVNADSCLHHASAKNKQKLVSFLLAYKIDPNQAMNHGFTPLSTAVQKGHKEIAELLLKYEADPNQAMNNGFTPLYTAAEKGHKDIAELLLKYGADPNQVMNNGFTPLYAAVQKGHKDIAELLLKYGADPNQAMNHDFTPLYTAAQKGNKDVAELLLKYGADPTREVQGFTPLHTAAEKGNKDVAELLLKCGADPTREYGGFNAIKLAKTMNFDALAKLLEDVASGKIKYSPSDCPSYNYDTTTKVSMVGDSNDYSHDEL